MTAHSCLVFGKTGQVAHGIGRLGSRYDRLDITQLGRDQADFTDPQAVAAQVLKHKPAVVINAVAYTKVDQAETDDHTAMLVNAHAPGLMAEACESVGAALIHLSTDYVFPGDGDRPYVETDPIGPTGAYGRSKSVGELAVKAALRRHVILRTSWVFSDVGQNFVKTMLRLNRDLIRVVDDQTGNPTPAPAIAQACLEMATAICAGKDDGWGLYHFSGQPSVTWFGLAQAIFAQAEKLGRPAPTLEPITTDQYPLPARRPAWSVLNTDKILKEWGIEAPDWRHWLPEIVASLMEQGSTP